jgi:hypothetical protein
MEDECTGSDNSSNENHLEKNVRNNKSGQLKNTSSDDDANSIESISSKDDWEIQGSTTIGENQLNGVCQNAPKFLEKLDLHLGNTQIMQRILKNQEMIFDKIEEIANQQSGQSIFSANNNLTIVRLNTEQKSQISQFMRNKFDKIKFLRDEEWDQLGNQLLDPIFKIISISEEYERTSYVSIVKSFANGSINQKRAEIMRNLKQVAIGKLQI